MQTTEDQIVARIERLGEGKPSRQRIPLDIASRGSLKEVLRQYRPRNHTRLGGQRESRLKNRLRATLRRWLRLGFTPFTAAACPSHWDRNKVDNLSHFDRPNPRSY